MTVPIGNLAADGISVTLTSGSLPTWLTSANYGVGAQVTAYTTDGSGNSISPLFNVGVDVYGRKYSNKVPSSGIPTIATIADSTHFTITAGFVTASPTGYSNLRFYIGKAWLAPQKSFIYQNSNDVKNGGLNAPTGSDTSAGVGFLGADGGISVDLAPAGISKVAWFFADTYWATTLGQTRANSAFIHNCIAIQNYTGFSAPDLSRDTATFYTRYFPESTFPGLPAEDVPNGEAQTYYWPQGAICLSNRILLSVLRVQQSSSGFSYDGYSVFSVGNLSATPDLWTFTEVASPFFTGSVGASMANWCDDGTYVYQSGFTSQVSSYAAYLVRWLKSDVTASPSNLMRPQYWCGQNIGWVDFSSIYGSDNISAPDQLGVYYYESIAADANGSTWRNSRGVYSMLQASDGVTPQGIRVRQNATLEPSGNTRLGDVVFYPPNDVGISATNQSIFWYYAGHIHAEQTWSGQGVDDVVVTYATNLHASTLITDSANYYIQIIRVAGL